MVDDGGDAPPRSATDGTPWALMGAVPYLMVRDGEIVEVGPELARELDHDTSGMRGPLRSIGKVLDDAGFDELLRDGVAIRVRLRPDLGERPVRLRPLVDAPSGLYIEMRSLAAEFRLESLLRRSGAGHMLLTPDVQLVWSMSANELAEVFPGDDPRSWLELMDADDMQELGRSIFAVGRDPQTRRVVRHRLRGDRTRTIIDVVESAMHDPDLRAVLVRSRLEDTAIAELSGSSAPFAGLTVSDHMPIGVVLASSTGTILHRNSAAAELIGARAAMRALPGDGDWLLTGSSDEDIGRYTSVFARAVAGTASFCTVAAPTQADRWLRVSVSPAAASTVVMTIEDSTELVEAERALRGSVRLLDALDAHSEEFVIVFVEDGTTRYISSSVRRLLGDDADLKHTDDVFELVHLADRAEMIDLVRRVNAHPGVSETVEARLGTGPEASHRWHQATMTNLIDDVDIGGFVLTVRDIHERHLLERELRYQATHDPLTTLPDRAALRAMLDDALSDPEACNHLTVVMFCDVDHFKAVNDDHGHHVGDLVLTEVSGRLRSAVRHGDLVARFGGDEFVIVAPGVVDIDEARVLAARTHAAVSGSVTIHDTTIDLSISIGVAVGNPATATAETLIRDADTAMYRAKRIGRNCIGFHESMHDDRGETR